MRTGDRFRCRLVIRPYAEGIRSGMLLVQRLTARLPAKGYRTTVRAIPLTLAIVLTLLMVLRPAFGRISLRRVPASDQIRGRTPGQGGRSRCRLFCGSAPQLGGTQTAITPPSSDFDYRPTIRPDHFPHARHSVIVREGFDLADAAAVHDRWCVGKDAAINFAVRLRENRLSDGPFNCVCCHAVPCF